MKIEITGIGADPELFVTKNGEIVSGIGKVGGTKAKPVPLGLPGYFVQEDNVLAEFNIPPAASEKEFADNISTGLRLLTVRLSPRYGVVAKASHEMPEKELKSKKAMAFGCDPDILAWDNIEHVANPPASGLRTGGGHFHFGYKNPDREINLKLAKAFDIFHGVPSVLLDPDTKRREVYGGAGAFRHKPYGLEYRSLSSFWVSDSKLCKWVFNNAKHAAEFVESGGVDELTFLDKIDVTTAINLCEKSLAEKIIEQFKVKLP